MKTYYQKRIERLQELLKTEPYDIVAINAGQSQVYYSGMHFHLSERPAVLLIGKGGKTAFIHPEFEGRKLVNAPIDTEAFSFTENRSTWGPAFHDAVSFFAGNNPTIAVEPTCMRFLEMDLLRFNNKSIQFSSAAHLIENMRAKKDESEIAAMRKAIQIAETALEQTMPTIKPGVNELTIANELVINLLRNGSDPELPFAPIVAGGPNSANPHATPGERELVTGDLLIIDWGARSNGYISDITRTLAIGNIDNQLREIFDVVKTANTAARSTSEEELFADKIDEKARAIIRDAGYGEAFNHRTGHGIGLEAHESPYISSDNKNHIKTGNTFTIEPGIYLVGKGGVRIEDNMVARENQLETLTTFSRDLHTI